MSELNDKIDKILKETPLETRLKVLSEMDFITLITELGYREEKFWTPEEDELLGKLCKLAKKHTDSILKEIEEWKKDGSPKIPTKISPRGKYFVGSASVFGKLVAKPEILTEFSRKDFFDLLDEEQSNSGLCESQFRLETRKKVNLKQGITVGSQFFIATYESPNKKS
jgi:hypothetical protein